MPGEWERLQRRREAHLNHTSMPLRKLHQHLPHWVKVILNGWMKRYGDPGDRSR